MRKQKTTMHCPGRLGGRGCGRLMCGPAVVVEDVGAGPVCGCYQKFQTNQLFEIPSGSAMVQATPVDAVGHDMTFSTKIYCVYKIYFFAAKKRKYGEYGNDN